jgi:2-C-methyl-D-erythritol 4-phosphate cytidylyltransferase
MRCWKIRCARPPKFGAAAPAIPVKDTIKVSRSGAVDETPDRSRLYAVQTPQVFDFDLFRGAMEKAAGKRQRADGRLLRRRAHRHEGAADARLSEENLKITTPLDLHPGGD